MPAFDVEVGWSAYGTVRVVAKDEEDARDKASAGPLPTDAEYVDSSFEITEVHSLDDGDYEFKRIQRRIHVRRSKGR